MWEKVKLGELVSQHGGLIQTGPFGSQLHEADYSEVGIPVVMPKDIIDGKISEESAAKISDDIYRKLKRHALAIGDIVLPRRGNLDKRAVITEREKGWLCGTGCLKINVNPEVLDSTYLFYYLALPEIVEYLENMAVGSTMLNLSAGILEKFTFPLPPLALQQQIAAVLGRYDALLENYQGQVVALEGMAQELYQEWFVRGRCPGSKAGSLGELPAGWKQVKFTDVISVQSGGTPKTSEPNYWDGDVYWFSPGDVENSYYVLKTDKTITELGLKNCNSKLYPVDTVVITARGTVGKCVLLGRPMAINQSNYALLGQSVSQYFTFFKTLEMAEALQKEANGAVFSTITTDNFERAEILVPDTKSLAAFDKLVAPIFGAIRNCLEQSETLRATRDALLPRLLSGQLLPAPSPAAIA